MERVRVLERRYVFEDIFKIEEVVIEHRKHDGAWSAPARQLSVEGAYLEHAMESYADAESVGGELPSIAEQLGKRLAAMTVEDAMIRKVETIGKTASLKTVAEKMLSSRHRRLIVVDDDGKIAGIVTSTDLVRVIAERS